MLRQWILRKPRYVNVDVQTCRLPPPENQHIDDRKWQWIITINFHRLLPSIGAEAFGDLNKLLLMVEADRFFVGYTFVEIFTDDPGKHNTRELVVAVCKCFGFTLGEMRELKSSPLGRS